MASSAASARTAGESRLHDDERHWTLAPFGVLDGDDRRLHDAALLRDDVLDLNRGNPFATALDDVLDPVDDVDVPVGVPGRDVSGVHIAAGPELLRRRRIVEIAHGEPWGARDDLASGFSVVRHVCHVRVDDAQIDERRRQSGARAPLHLRLRIFRQLLRRQMHPAQHRGGLGLPIAGEDVDAAFERGSGQRPRHCGASDHHLQPGEIDVLAPRRREQHLQDRRDAMRGRHALSRDQPQQDIRRVAARVDLLVAHHGVQVWASPCVDVKHRRQRHVDVFPVNPSLAGSRAIFRHDGERVQHQLTMAEVDAFRAARRAGGVKRRRAGVLVEIGKLEERRIRLQHLLVFAFDRQPRGRLLLAIMQHHVVPHRRQLVGHLLDERQEIRIDQTRSRALRRSLRTATLPAEGKD